MIRSRRFFAILACAGVALTAVLAALGQFGPDPQFSQVDLTVSDYAVADRGGVTEWAMVAFGASGLALLLALRRPSRPVTALLSLFAVAMIIAAVAPTDPGTQLTITGHIHRYASMAAFVALPASALILALDRADLPRRVAAWIRGLAIASTAFMLAMLVSATLVDRTMIGLVERLLLGTGVVLLGILAGWAVRSASLDRRDPDGATPIEDELRAG